MNRVLTATAACLLFAPWSARTEEAPKSIFKEKPAVKLGLVQINVTDLKKAKEFYRDKLGLEVREPLKKEGAPFEIATEGAATILVYQVEKQAKVDYPNQTGVTLCFYTQDLDKTIKAWKEKGVEFIKITWSKDDSGTAECPFGRFIAFKDPFGNVHEVLQPSK